MPRVLIADDEDSMRTLVARAIAMDGHTTVIAEDGAEANAETRAEVKLSMCLLLRHKQRGCFAYCEPS